MILRHSFDWAGYEAHCSEETSALRSGAARWNVTRRLALCLSAEEIRAKGLDSIQEQHAFQMVNFMLKG